MYQIDNHEEEAQKSIIPYLLSFDKIQSITEYCGTRAQYLEDVLWQMLQSTDINSASGIWLDNIGKKVGKNRVYYNSPTDGFTFKGTTDQGFGAGRFLSGIGSTDTTRQLRSNAQFRSAIRAKIIQNNTDCKSTDLINACKLLFNASIVNIQESYPSGVEYINLYGSSLLESSDAYSLCKLMMATSVNLGSVNFIHLYNLFKKNAFISYNSTLPNANDFTLSFSFVPDTLTSTYIPLFSQDIDYNTTNPTIGISYNNTDGVHISFKIPDVIYSDQDGNPYSDQDGIYYADGIITVDLKGGTIHTGEINYVKLVRVGNSVSLYVNNVLVDSFTRAELFMDNSSDARIFLGAGNSSFFNSGSIYNLLITNDTLNQIVINDNLKVKTIGTNNGVKFI